MLGNPKFSTFLLGACEKMEPRVFSQPNSASQGPISKAAVHGLAPPAELLIISLCGVGGWVFLRSRLASPGSPEWSGGFNRVTGAAAFSTTGNHFTPLPPPSFLPPSLPRPSFPPSLLSFLPLSTCKPRAVMAPE